MTARIAIITGGNRGIGRDAVLRLAAAGETCILTYNTGRAEADAVVALAQAAGAKAVALHLDVADAASFDGFVSDVRAALAELGAERFDHLVNNAGTSSAKTLRRWTRSTPSTSRDRCT